MVCTPLRKRTSYLGDAAASDIQNGPSATVTTPSGTVSGNVSIGYSLASADEWASFQHHRTVQHGWRRELARRNLGPGGSSTSGLSVSPSGNTYTYVWNSSADFRRIARK